MGSTQLIPGCQSMSSHGQTPLLPKQGQHCSQARMYQSDIAQTVSSPGLAGELEALQGVMGTGNQTEVLGRLVSRVATLEAAAGEAEAQRRTLHNQLVELRGNVSLVPLHSCNMQKCVCLLDHPFFVV